MILRIFIAIMALHTLHATMLEGRHENESLLARKATTEQHTSWSVLSVMSSAYHMVVDHKPTPEKVLREQVRNIVFSDGRNAAGELVRDYKRPSVNEVVVNLDSTARLTVALTGDTMRRTDNISTYIKALQAIISFASKGDPCALSNLAWLFTSGDNSTCAIRWPYIDRERASLFREAGEEEQKCSQSKEAACEILHKLLEKSRSSSLLTDYQNKKSR